MLGYELEAEGVRIVEFAQCGVSPLVKAANALGIEWHLLADGDHSGASYEQDAAGALGGRSREERVSRLEQRDIEGCLWAHGYDHVYRTAARSRGGARPMNKGRTIAKAARLTSKPWLALEAAEAIAQRGPEGVPPVLRGVVEASVRLARASVAG